MMIESFAVAAGLSLAAGLFAWSSDPKRVARLTAEAAGRPINFDESRVAPYTLPNPLADEKGGQITSAQQWEQVGRPRTLELFREHVYGRTTGPSQMTFDVLETEPAALEGRATRKSIRITSTQGNASYTFEASLLTPNHSDAPVPVFLFINNRKPDLADPTRQNRSDFWPAEEIIRRGYGTAVFHTGDVDPDRTGSDARAAGVRGALPAGGAPERDGWATIGAWAWGASRVLDYLQTDPAVDAAKVAVIGHSRGGKTALWAGAQDTRFAMAISNESGCGGAALSRRNLGETITSINENFDFWFCANFHKYGGRADQLPIDQHQLIALMAPRAVATGSAGNDLWADPRGEFLALAAASSVYALYQEPPVNSDEMPSLSIPLNRSTRHYHIRAGGHGLTPQDWTYYMDFADHLWR